jgi:tetratricopeptide (TPR) repeat protein
MYFWKVLANEGTPDQRVPGSLGASHLSVLRVYLRVYSMWSDQGIPIPTEDRVLMGILRRVFASGCALVTIASIGCTTSPQAKEAKYLMRGQAEMAKKDYPRAVLEFKNAIAAMPNDAEPYYRRGLALLANHSLGEAADSFRKATELNPNHSAAQLKLAELLTTTQNKVLIEQAATRLQDILAASPDNREASSALAIAEINLGKPEDAAKRLEETLQKFPATLRASVTLAQVKLGQQDLKGAEEVLKNAVSSAPKSPEAALALGQFYLMLRQPWNAEPAIRKALEFNPKSARALMDLAAIQSAGNRMTELDQTYAQLAALPGKDYRAIHAAFLYQTGKKEAGLAELEKLAKKDPDDRIVRSNLVSFYIGMNTIGRAQDLLAAALKRNPKDTDALLQRSQMYLRLGKLSEAVQDLNQVLHIRPDSPEAHFALAGVYQAQGSNQLSIQELQTALRLKPELLQARLALTHDMLLKNQAQAALALLDEAPAEQKASLGVIIQRNWALMEAGNSRTVTAILERALQANRNPELLLQRAVLTMEQRDYTRARGDAEEMLQRNPEDLRAARIVVSTYLAQDESDKALRRLTEIVAYRPKSAPLQYFLGQWYLQHGNLAEAANAFQAAKAADSSFLQADLALAEVDRQQNRPDAARQLLTGIFAIDPKNVASLLSLAQLDVAGGDMAGAIARYRTVLSIDASNLVALNNLAYYLALDHPDEALPFAERAGKIAADDATVQDTLGWVYYRKGQYRTAMGYLKTAVARQPTARRQFHLAMSYLKLGERSLGQSVLQTALLQDPTLPQTEHGW